jgi:hypothetical protein
MSGLAEAMLRELRACGSCSDSPEKSDGELRNRPGLSAIAYRVGTQATFKAAMLAALSNSKRPVLQALRTRDDDDFSIALLDAAATVSDVLAFYQERIANESYLRTAGERRSILELAGLIGYALRPGMAASTFFAFTVDETPGAPKKIDIDIGTKVQSIPAPGEKPQTFETVEKIEARSDWNALRPQRTVAQTIGRGTTEIWLRGVNTQLTPGDAILIVGAERTNNPTSPSDKERWDFRIVSTVTTNAAHNATIVTWDEGLGKSGTQPAVTGVKCFALRQRAKLFGHNAPNWYAMSHSVRKAYLASYDENKSATWGTDWPKMLVAPDGSAQKRTNLDLAYPKILVGGWVVLKKAGLAELYKVTETNTESISDFAMSSTATQLTFDTEENLAQFRIRETTVFAQSEELEIAEVPARNIAGHSFEIEPTTRIEGLVKGRPIACSGLDEKGQPRAEMTLIREISSQTLTVDPPLRHTYTIESFSINANVARATHGETVQEVLGNGDASARFQKFSLKQPRLTYVSATTASGVASTLEVRVNDLLWHEAPTLYGKSRKDHAFIARQDDAGQTHLEFGDGITGARLPSGQMNIRARYRRGIGLEGVLKGGQLSMLLSRPQGLKGVTNPTDTNGAQAPEHLAEARTNAPLTVRTLDRAVSLEDYEDFARAFGGIAKAAATWAWDGRARRLYLTVAGPQGAAIPAESDTFRNLVGALQKGGDPFIPLQVMSYRPVLFRVSGNVKIDADFENNKVLIDVNNKLHEAFSFENRDLGQPVFLSEVIELVQGVAGVIAVQVNDFRRADAKMTVLAQRLNPFRLVGTKMPVLEKRLLAASASQSSSGIVLPTELLLLDAESINSFGVMS